MLVPHKIKKMANVAEKQIGNHVTDAKKFVNSMGRRTTSSLSTNSTTNKVTKATKPNVPSSSNAGNRTVLHPSNETSYMAKQLLWAHFIPPMPVIASTMYRHYKKGPPAKSWSLSTDITIAVIRNFLERSSKITVEDIQSLTTTKKLPIPSSMKRTKFTVPNEYRKRAGDILMKQFTKKDLERIGWDWEKDRENAPPLKGEWLQAKGNPLDPCKESTVLYLHGGAYYLCCYGMYRQFLSRLIKHMKGTTCAIDYRLAPQHPFPAAVEDALATYLYMIDPPKGIQPISPEKIVVSGDSAGGGLTFALLIAIRDAKLPAPAGAMTLSPWVDLTHSFPSIMTNIATDYLPPVGFKHAPSPALDYARLPYKKEDAEMLEQARAEASASVTTDTDGKLEVPVDKSDANRRISIGPFGECIPRASIDGSDVYRVQFYADNDALKIPMVSPVFDRRHLRGLPRVLVQCGTAERLRDESVYLALQASNAFSEDNENTASRDKLTNITLEMYTDQPHVFQLFFSHKCTSRAVKNLAAFVRDVTNSPASHNNSKQRKNEHQQQHQLTTKDHGCKANYLSDEKLNIWKIDPQGNMADVKEQMLKNFSREEWKEWKRRLDRPSIKERIDEVVDAFNKFAKNEPTAQDKQ